MFSISNCIGSFVFDDSIIEESLFKEEDIVKNHKLLIAGQPLREEAELEKKHGAKRADEKAKAKFITLIKGKHLDSFRKANILITKEMVKESVKEDNLVTQAINDIEEIERSANLLAKRLREWYELYNPESSRSIEGHEEFIEAILSKSKKQLQEEFRIKHTMGADLDGEDVKPMLALAGKIKDLYSLRDSQKQYVEAVMKKSFPNIEALAGPIIGAKLLAQAGGIKRLSEFPASTLQLLGAEKALFRHIKTGSRPPKYGLLINHPLISGAKADDRGKVARALANKLSIAAKVDYFKGEFVGGRIKEELEKKFGKR